VRAAAERRDRGAIIEQPGVEEIRTHAPRFERELAKAQRLSRQRELDELTLVVAHSLTLPIHTAGYHPMVSSITSYVFST